MSKKKDTSELDADLFGGLNKFEPGKESNYGEVKIPKKRGVVKEVFHEVRQYQLTKEECFIVGKQINILALDVATHTGWCTKTAHGTWDFSLKRDESAGMRLVRFKAKLREMCALEEINLVTFELSQGFHQNAVIVQSELHGVLKLYCEENKIDYRSFAPSEIKKFATGKGSANKEKMVEAAQQMYGYFGNDDNTADAMHIFHLTKKSLNL